MSNETDILQRLNRRVLADIALRLENLGVREHNAHLMLVECENERKRLLAQREAVIAAEKVQLEHLAPSDQPPFSAGNGATESADSLIESAPHRSCDDVEDEGGGEKQRRARVGPQRYLILSSLRLEGPMTLDQIVNMTRLGAKRVKDQFRVDVPEIIKETTIENFTGSGPFFETKYELTSMGKNLLTRYETYKRHRGEPLPSLADIAVAEMEGRA